MSSTSSTQDPPRIAASRTILAGLSASLVGIGLARFAYTPLIPPLIQAHWFSASDVISLGAANLAGYLVGALLGRPIGQRIGNAHALRAMMLAVTVAFLACGFPVSVIWFFFWRFVSGVAGGTIMVLVAATLLPHVPQARRGLTSGAIFLGLGLGIAGSGTVVPLLLGLGLRDTWIGLAVVSAAFTAASWFAWPGAAAAVQAPAIAHDAQPGAASRTMAVFYAQYALMAVGLVPAMVFLVDFIARGLQQGAHVGALFWVLYGVGAIFGPPLYGLLGDKLGPRKALRAVLGVQAIALLGLYVLSTPLTLGLVAIVIGTFPPGIVPVVLARVHELEPHSPARQNSTWSRATTVFAAAQAVAGYAYSALFNASHGDHRLLFLIAAAGIVVSLAIDFVVIAERGQQPQLGRAGG
ncbi:YbfB/YjiJ family MFS transporter [Paucibacter sp. R3-3]|uniref:YbfB/YjiJ family MFS transporter n=1 Tax=Roseateles agri TaxID=3098619 RepID=A0ABU5DM49_9BURK|nr:YbfB/YjiJ family MFS transporter [Paucibacter sp. R3-3]MDY0747380.1 YbfB/YjiJ family MFS transporter [Paucibacter sp. R3-3]